MAGESAREGSQMDETTSQVVSVDGHRITLTHLDLMEALRRSVERSRGGGKVGTAAEGEDTARPAKRRIP